MKNFAAVICEYNPFHFGHEYQIKEIKKEYDGVICVMSGNLVQRGEVAVADKYIRAEAAVRCGADLVLELPFPYSCLSARDFAAAGVEIAAASGANALAFGCEDSPELLYRLYDYISSPGFKENLSKYIKEYKNLSFPTAITRLAEAGLGKEYADAISKPNNILALEYISAIRKGGHKLDIFPIRREKFFKSSSAIRSIIAEKNLEGLVPGECVKVYAKQGSDQYPRSNENFSRYILASLRQAKPNAAIYGYAPNLQKAIINGAAETTSFEHLIDSTKNKIHTAARIRRMVYAMTFGFTNEEALNKPDYTLLLAADKNGCEYLNENGSSIRIPIITKPAHVKRLSGLLKEKILRNSDIDSALSLSSPLPGRHDFYRKTPFILK